MKINSKKIGENSKNEIREKNLKKNLKKINSKIKNQGNKKNCNIESK